MAKAFHDLTEREILALAISLEEEDGRNYGEFAERLRADYPATAADLARLRDSLVRSLPIAAAVAKAAAAARTPTSRRPGLQGRRSR